MIFSVLVWACACPPASVPTTSATAPSQPSLCMTHPCFNRSGRSLICFCAAGKVPGGDRAGAGCHMLKIGAIGSRRLRLRLWVADQRFEAVVAAVARPEVADAPVVDVFAPFRGEQPIAALRARRDRPGFQE